MVREVVYGSGGMVEIKEKGRRKQILEFPVGQCAFLFCDAKNRVDDGGSMPNTILLCNKDKVFEYFSFIILQKSFDSLGCKAKTIFLLKINKITET